MHPRRTVTTRTDEGPRTATFAEVLGRARRLVSARRALGVREVERVASPCSRRRPDDVVFVEALPRTSVGRLDERVLRARCEDHVLPGRRP